MILDGGFHDGLGRDFSAGYGLGSGDPEDESDEADGGEEGDASRPAAFAADGPIRR